MSKLFYVIGASGAGKDTLMNYARQKLNGLVKVAFAHRYITRPPFEGAENHVSISAQEFELRQQAGLFALYWHSHGKHYGIGTEINIWMSAGFNVVVNGSREYLPVALRHYPDMIIVLIEASPAIIAHRLANRGRESTEEIQKRLSRTIQIDAVTGNCIRITNDDSVEQAGEELLSLICS